MLSRKIQEGFNRQIWPTLGVFSLRFGPMYDQICFELLIFLHIVRMETFFFWHKASFLHSGFRELGNKIWHGSSSWQYEKTQHWPCSFFFFSRFIQGWKLPKTPQNAVQLRLTKKKSKRTRPALSLFTLPWRKIAPKFSFPDLSKPWCEGSKPKCFARRWNPLVRVLLVFSVLCCLTDVCTAPTWTNCLPWPFSAAWWWMHHLCVLHGTSIHFFSVFWCQMNGCADSYVVYGVLVFSVFWCLVDVSWMFAQLLSYFVCLLELFFCCLPDSCSAPKSMRSTFCCLVHVCTPLRCSFFFSSSFSAVWWHVCAVPLLFVSRLFLLSDGRFFTSPYCWWPSLLSVVWLGVCTAPPCVARLRFGWAMDVCTDPMLLVSSCFVVWRKSAPPLVESM